MPPLTRREAAAPDPRDEFRADVLAGLTGPHKAIPCKYLYDARGSALFEAICRLPEYYPTRTEEKILRRHAAEIAAYAQGLRELVEFGSGSSRKTRILLDAMAGLRRYLPIDVSREHLAQSAAAIAADYPRLAVDGICADYMDPRQLEAAGAGAAPDRIGFFPGSTIGNLTPEEARQFLRLAARLVGQRGLMLIGVDLKKDHDRLHAAYNDSAGVTAAFSLNLLVRMNRELEGGFVLARFEHEAFYNPEAGRIEIYLRSLERQNVTVAGRRFAFEADERIHTEYSYKYSVAEFQTLAGEAGWAPLGVWTDPEALFSVHLLRPAAG